MTQFINAKETLVTSAIDGLLRSSGGANLARLDGYPGIKVVFRTDRNPNRVAVICGGGSGHEPAHAGFVGKGLLTAAVCGEVFASPSVDAVFAAIMAVTGKAGCLLILKNYTGDRLNFGLAAERARALGKKVEVLIVADDIALPGIAQPRGIAGVMFVEKVAGHFAERGANLATVAAKAREVSQGLVSLGIALSSCTLPGIGREDRIPKGKAELGLGIHGEPGIDLVKFATARDSVRVVLDRLFAKVRPAKAYAVLINNLGSTTPIEMGLIVNEVLTSRQAKKIKLVVGPAPLVTSLDMHGYSLSLLPLTPAIETALKSAATPSVWPGVRLNQAPRLVKLPKASASAAHRASRNPALAAFVIRACDILIGAEKALNALDAKVGDGDTGSTIATAARTVKQSLAKMPQADPTKFLSTLSETLTRGMGGSSGVLLAIFFAAASRTSGSWTARLQAGLEALMAYGGAKPGDRTMVDALAPALAALSKGGSLKAAAKAARAGANATAKMKKARAGRSVYLSAKSLSGIKDPGAEGVALLFEGLA